MSLASPKAALLGSCGAFIPVCILTVALRFFVRRKQKLSLLADDWFMLGSLIFFLAFQACVIVFVLRLRYMGYVEDPVPPDQLQSQYLEAGKLIVSSDMLLIWALTLVKLSALFLYRRIFCHNGAFYNKWQRIILGSVAIVIGWMVAFCIVNGVQSPYLWQRSYLIDDGKRVRLPNIEYQYMLSFLISDMVLDVWVICMPIIFISQLQMNLTKKLVTTAMFLTASVGTAASAVRLGTWCETNSFNPGTQALGYRQGGQSLLHFYMIVECGMIIIGINIPVLWGLFAKLERDVTRGIGSLITRSTSAKPDMRNSPNRHVPDSIEMLVGPIDPDDCSKSKSSLGDSEHQGQITPPSRALFQSRDRRGFYR